MRSEKLNQIVLAALHRSGRPSTSEALEDIAQGLAAGHGWPAGVIEQLSRMSIAARLRHMSKTGLVEVVGGKKDTHGRQASAFRPVGGFDARFEMPEPHIRAQDSTYADLSREQLVVILRVQDEILSETSRFIEAMQGLTARAREQLATAGLEVPK